MWAKWGAVIARAIDHQLHNKWPGEVFCPSLTFLAHSAPVPLSPYDSLSLKDLCPTSKSLCSWLGIIKPPLVVYPSNSTRVRDQDYDAFTSKWVNGDPPNRAKLECWAGRFGSIKKAGGHTPEIAPTTASKVSAQKCPLFFFPQSGD